MKLFNSLFWVVFFILTSSLFSTTVNGRFTVISMDSLKFSVKLQINTDTGTDDLGGATIVFEFDTSTLSFTNNPIKDIDYVYHNFCGGNYSAATVTKPMNNMIWVNIDLPFSNNNNGTVVTGSPAWTDLVTIHFDILDTNGNASLSWLTPSFFWGIYDADNSTFWETGVFEDHNAPLPVELVSFTASVNQNNVLLNWTTVTETNNSGFEILRANVYPQSAIRNPQFKIIGFVQGQGTTTEKNNYSFTDEDIEPGSYSYKLVQIDFDGTRTESEYVNVEISSFPVEYSLSQNYPNPFNPSTKIRYTIPSVGTRDRISVQLKVYDILGNEIATLVDEEKLPGYHEVTFHSHFSNGWNISGGRQDLASGIYIYTLKSDNFIDTKKMILLK